VGDQDRDSEACERLRRDLLDLGWVHGHARGQLVSPDGRMQAITYMQGGQYLIEVAALVSPKRTRVVPGVRVEDVL
jgi:hypothetical protein